MVEGAGEEVGGYYAGYWDVAHGVFAVGFSFSTPFLKLPTLDAVD